MARRSQKTASIRAASRGDWVLTRKKECCRTVKGKRGRLQPAVQGRGWGHRNRCDSSRERRKKRPPEEKKKRKEEKKKEGAARRERKDVRTSLKRGVRPNGRRPANSRQGSPEEIWCQRGKKRRQDCDCEFSKKQINGSDVGGTKRGNKSKCRKRKKEKEKSQMNNAVKKKKAFSPKNPGDQKTLRVRHGYCPERNGKGEL